MNEAVANRTIRLLALVGAAAIIVLVIGLAAKLLQGPIKSLASLFSAISLTRERIVLEISPSSVFSGEQFLLAWKHEKRAEEGIYDFSYPCHPGLSITTEEKVIPCNSAYSVTGRTNLPLTAELKEGGSSDVPLTIAFTPEEADRPSISSTENVTIVAGEPSATTTPRTGTPTGGGRSTGPTFGQGTTTTIPISPAPRINPSGVPDLKVEIVGIGVLLRTATSTTEVFVARNTILQGEKAAIVFDVKNVGDNISGEWKFSAQLPISGGNFVSDMQPSLAPGNGVRFTIGFENLNNAGSNTVTITVDPEAKIWRDPNRLNNNIAVTVQRGY